MKRNLSILLIAVGVLLLSATSLCGQTGTGKLQGIWKMKSHDSGVKIEFSTVDRSNERETNSITINKSAISGFTRDNDGGFSLKKPGGEIKFTGDITAENGEGTFVYTPNGNYVKSLADTGFRDLSLHALLLFTLKNADVNYIESVKKLGYNDISKENLTALVALDVSADYIKDIQNDGFEDIALSKLIGFKALQVDPAYIARMKKLSGGDLSAGDIMSFAALKIDEKYAEEMYKTGYKLTGNDLIEFKALGITPEYVKEMMSTGFEEISQDEIVAAKGSADNPGLYKRG